jgi:hypothetical protein
LGLFLCKKIEHSTFNAEQSMNSREPLYRRSAAVPGRSHIQTIPRILSFAAGWP